LKSRSQTKKGKTQMMVEIGSSSYYSEDSIYLNIDGRLVIMDLATAKKFVDAVISVGRFHGLVN
jgi:hypothetical protein